MRAKERGRRGKALKMESKRGREGERERRKALTGDFDVLVCLERLFPSKGYVHPTVSIGRKRYLQTREEDTSTYVSLTKYSCFYSTVNIMHLS